MNLFDFFKKNKPQSQELPVIDEYEILKQSLIERFGKIGLTPNSIDANKFYLQEIETEIEYKIIKAKEDHPYVINIVLSVYNQDLFPELIEESIAGMSEDIENRINEALNRYFLVFFPNILNLLNKKEPTNEFEISEEGRKEKYKTYISDLQIVGEENFTFSSNKIYDSLKDYIKITLSEQRFLSWLKIEFFKSENNENIEVSCTFNNDRSITLENLLIELTPKLFDNLKLFGAKQWIFIEHSSAILKVKQDVKLSIRNYNSDFEKRLDKVFDAFYNYYEDHETLLTKLKEYSKNEEEYNLFYHFLTNIVHRVLHPQIKVPEYFICRMKNGKDVYYLYTNSKIYCLLVKYVKKNINAILSRDVLKILFNSSEFKSMNDLLKKGSKIENIVSTPYTILID